MVGSQHIWILKILREGYIQSVGIPRNLPRVCGGMRAFQHVRCQLSCGSPCGMLLGSAGVLFPLQYFPRGFAAAAATAAGNQKWKGAKVE